MKYRLLNFILCPKCKGFPLKLEYFRMEEYDRDVDIPKCDLYCGYTEKYIRDISDPPCSKCIRFEIIDGVLRCTRCGEYYPIIDTITIMHMDYLKPKKVLRRFTERYRDRLPKHIYRMWMED